MKLKLLLVTLCAISALYPMKRGLPLQARDENVPFQNQAQPPRKKVAQQTIDDTLSQVARLAKNDTYKAHMKLAQLFASARKDEDKIAIARNAQKFYTEAIARAAKKAKLSKKLHDPVVLRNHIIFLSRQAESFRLLAEQLEAALQKQPKENLLVTSMEISEEGDKAVPMEVD